MSNLEVHIEMNSYERDLARFILAWLPYGGPTNEDFIGIFGISMPRAAQILLPLVTEGAPDDLTESDRELLVQLVCNEPAIRALEAESCTAIEGGDADQPPSRPSSGHRQPEHVRRSARRDV
ncbi:hypothetical protein [Rhodococcus sp. LB1]|uniref:hypothetical protein n=1 Tax=Rhodococcus sp. LB1 TaxID=1807499 RepID=UPI00077ABA8A|nr:hypothetical protein [Rhodococcus sp. LB1]KXX58976.1 hypothetical protein AZG88_43135 [Rhodococcus sp. LB1]